MMEEHEMIQKYVAPVLIALLELIEPVLMIGVIFGVMLLLILAP